MEVLNWRAGTERSCAQNNPILSALKVWYNILFATSWKSIMASYQPEEYVMRNVHQIFKIWVPTHGVVNVYRKPNGGKYLSNLDSRVNSGSKKWGPTLFSLLSLLSEYHVDNGYLLEEPRKAYREETFRILTSHGAVIKVTRNREGGEESSQVNMIFKDTLMSSDKGIFFLS